MRHLRFRVVLPLVSLLALAGCAQQVANNSRPITSTGDQSGSAPSTDAATPAADSAPATPAAPPETAIGTETDPAKLVAQLNEASRELASLRVSNARLKAGRSSEPAAPVAPPEPIIRPEPTDEKLSASLKSYGQFKQELASFFADIEKARSENAALSAQLKDAAAQTQQAKESLAKLEGELRAERQSRSEAEQAAGKLREQLRAIARAISAAGLSINGLPTDAEPTARLETNESRVHTEAPSFSKATKYLVREGDNLEKIAEACYGDAKLWRVIVDANRGRLRLDGVLDVGMELEIPR